MVCRMRFALIIMSSRRPEGGRISVTQSENVLKILRFAQDDILGRGEISRVLENIHSNERSDVASEIGLTFWA